MVSPWLQALLVTPKTVCGVPLKPFSVFHALCLSEMGNPYIVGGDYTLAALCEAVFVCSRTRLEAMHDFARFSPESAKKLRRQYKSDDSMALESERLTAHLNDYWRVENRAKPEKAGDETVVPWQFHVVRSVAMNYGVHPDSVWDMPVNLAVCYCDAVNAYNGDKSLQTKSERWLEENIAEANRLKESGDIEAAEAKDREIQDYLNSRMER